MADLNLKQLSQVINRLDKMGHPDSTRVAQEILEFSQSNKSLTERILTRLSNEEPWEYIKGSVTFLDNTLRVNKNTLIPRIETEDLVQIVIDKLPSDVDTIIDVGTGCGNIIVSLYKELDSKNIRFIATDISSEAINVAKFNTETEKIDLHNTNLIQGIDLRDSKSVVIVANLPYIPKKDYQSLQKSVRDYEPKAALIGGNDGYELIVELVQQIDWTVHNISKIFLEIDPKYSQEIATILEGMILNSEIEIKNDQFNKERFLIINLPLQA